MGAKGSSMRTKHTADRPIKGKIELGDTGKAIRWRHEPIHNDPGRDWELDVVYRWNGRSFKFDYKQAGDAAEAGPPFGLYPPAKKADPSGTDGSTWRVRFGWMGRRSWGSAHERGYVIFDIRTMSRQNVPMLPGMGYDRKVGKTRFHKSQGFGFINGEVPITDATKPGIGGDPLTGQVRSSKTTSFPTDGSPAQPAWLAFDRKVLRFYAYFRESVHERQDETHRVRYCTILFYLEDDTVQINERITDNSGMPQGILVRRHRVPNSQNDNEFLNVYDFNVDTQVTIYARTFKIVDCDGFTHDFLTKLGVVVRDPCDAPVDPYTVYRAEKADAMQPLRPYEVQDTLAKFLKHDLQVLRFYGLWDDTSTPHGDKRFLVLHYFLSDDQMEINEILPPNSGRDGAGSFLKKQKVPKSTEALAKPPGSFADRTVLNVVGGGGKAKSSSILDSLRLGANTDEYYSDQDLKIGNTIMVFGRPILLHDCDTFTKMYYAEKYGVSDFTPIHVQDKPKPPPPKVIPPPTGYGTESDSMISVDRLVLQPPRQKAGRYYPENYTGDEGSLILRFEAILDTTDPLDTDRKFIVAYYLFDDTVAIFEQASRNSGQRAGKFLERGDWKNDETGSSFDLADFSVGAKVSVLSRTFVITDADEYAKNYMANLGDKLKRSN